jgi:pyruvate kinase
MNEFIENTHELFNDVVNQIAEKSLVKNGEVIVVTGSTQHSSGATNALQAYMVGNILVKGTGHGTENVSGRLCVLKEDDTDLSSFIPGDILVVSRTTNDILHMLRQCSGVITEESESNSGLVPAGYALDIPVIADAKGATLVLKSGIKVRLDPETGCVYNSDVNE